MTNIFGKNENLELFNKAGKRVYEYDKNSNNYIREFTYNNNGNQLTFRDSEGYSYECTYDKNNNQLIFGNSNGGTRGFDIPEYTMNELTKILGKTFKLKK